MNSEHSSLLKTRAESFTRHLQTRLKSLSESEDSTWSGVPDTEVYYDIDSSLASPQEEVGEPIFIAPQNRDDFHLQRSDSEASTYFDSVENFDGLTLQTSVSPRKASFDFFNLKNNVEVIAINGRSSSIEDGDSFSRRESSSSSLSQLSTENEMPNGQSDYLDDSDSNGALEMPSQRLKLDIIGKETEVCCDSLDKVVERNNNSESCIEEITGCEFNSENIDDITLVEVDTGQIEGKAFEDLGKNIRSVDSLTCVFCDIEEIKSSLSNGWADHQSVSECMASIETKSKENETLNICPSIIDDSCQDCNFSNIKNKCLESQCKSNIKSSKNTPQNDLKKGNVSDILITDNNVPIQDLLQLLKDEIKSDKDEIERIAEANLSETNESQTNCPNIKVREPSPSIESKSNKSDEEEFDIETKRKNFRRSSSLKSGKTPPGTPGRKKIVRFADVLGLDLADVKTFLDEVPTVPKSAFQDLQGVELNTEELSTNKITIVIPQIEKILVPLFQQPCLQPNFLDRVREKNVCLENAVVSDMSLFAITGLVRVKNIDFHKSVYVRYSINNWQSFSDLQARYIPNSCDGFSDKFSFVLYAHTLSIGQKLEFAVRFHTAGQQFWDSNNGLNYSFACCPAEPRTFITSPVSLPLNSDETAAFY